MSYWMAGPTVNMPDISTVSGGGLLEPLVDGVTVPETGERGGPELLNFMVKKICGHLELFGFRHGASRWNSRIRIDPLRLPPRSEPTQPHCRWAIEMSHDTVDYAKDPGPYVTKHGLQFEKDREIVNYEAGKYSRTHTQPDDAPRR
jgi:hypothetical protein